MIPSHHDLEWRGGLNYPAKSARNSSSGPAGLADWRRVTRQLFNYIKNLKSGMKIAPQSPKDILGF
jgi:hypothetical protein